MAKEELIHGPLGDGTLHLCVDMQRLFAAGSPWAVPWMEKVLPAIEEIAGRHGRATVFTRFVPPNHPEEAKGMWARYYRRWEAVTLDRIGADKVELVPALARFAPPVTVVDKRVYSPWTEGRLDALLGGSGVHTLVITGGETDVCVLATVMGAIDRGFRVVLVTDAICSSTDATHDALMTLYRSRFSEQVEIARTETVLSNWQA
jgi:nicotinamidase-related amidase